MHELHRVHSHACMHADPFAPDAAVVVVRYFEHNSSITGRSPKVITTANAAGMQTATVHLPDNCHISEPLQGPERSNAAAAEAAAAVMCLQNLQELGVLAG